MQNTFARLVFYDREEITPDDPALLPNFQNEDVTDCNSDISKL